MTERFTARPAPGKPIAHPALDRDLIARLVSRFYGRIAEDARLGPIFNRRLEGHWDAHLEKMTEFWSSIMLKTASYDGRPVPTHLRLKEVVAPDFAIWLALFRETAEELCPPDLAEMFIRHAERIAQSLQFAMFYRLPPHAGPSAGLQDAG